MDDSYQTTNIFYYDDANAPLGLLQWLPTEEENPILPANVPSEATIYSSCLGLVTLRCNATSTYHVGNPFVSDTVGDMIRYSDLPAPPTDHRPMGTHVVLASDPLSEGFLVYCAFRGVDNLYRFETFDSTSNRWSSVQFGPGQLCGLDIVPHSGASCHKTAYWLLRDSTGARVYVLQFDGLYMCKFLPPQVPGRIRIKLGRVWTAIGMGLVAVIVSEDCYTVELYDLTDESINARRWRRFELFRIEVPRADDAAAYGEGWVASWRKEDRTLVCRELPWPIRFDSLTVELLFWVRGPGRVLLLAMNSRTDPRGYCLTVLPGVWPSSITEGVPHVSTAFLPRDF